VQHRSAIARAALGGALLTGVLLGTLIVLNPFEVYYLRHRRQLQTASERYAIPTRLLAAVVWEESRFRPQRVGSAGERGLMQVTTGAAAEWARAAAVRAPGPEALLDPGTNLLAGAWYLRRSLNRWAREPDPLPLALAEYNAGASRVRRWRGGQPAGTDFLDAIEFPSTRRYVAEILARYRRFDRSAKPPR
jgi:soluble lytic murein transglycosylase